MTQSIRISASFVVALIGLFLASAAASLAADTVPARLAEVDATADMISFQPVIPHSLVRITVTGPDGFVVVRWFAAGEAAGIELPGIDGHYKYELRFAPILDREAREALAAARRAGMEPAGMPEQTLVQSGSFSIADGSVVADVVEPEAKVVLTNGDGVIRNSLCVGFDCPDAPAFGDSTILMMENNTRVKFGDTSNSPFPNNDWEIEANSSVSGAANYLGFNDCGTADNDGGCATDLVFAVEAGARQSALYVESDGDIGIGTSNPVVDLHVVTGNTPTLRLDQDASSGFASQVWDIAGNETNFFVRDVTGGSTLPLRIRPGAPSSSIDIDSDGDVGIGTASPDAHLDIENNGSFAFFRLTASTASPNTAADMTFTDAGASGAFRINIVDADAEEFEVDSDGNVTISGEITTASGTSPFPDFVFEPGYQLMPLAELADFVEARKHLPSIPSASEVKADGGRLNMTAMQLKLLEKVEELTLYAIRQDRALAEQRQVIEELHQRLTGLEGEAE